MIVKLFIAILITVVHHQVGESKNITNAIRSRSGESIPCNNGLGECVPYYLCKDGMINTDGSGLMDIRVDIQDVPGDECPDIFEQCCQNDFVLETITWKPPPPPEEESCGRRQPDGIGFRITNQKNNESEYGEFPWMAAILKQEFLGDEPLSVFQCGGSLIHPLAVLTAAHCVDGIDPGSLKVRLGEWDTQTKNELYEHVDYAVKDITIHKSYKKSNMIHDIAIVFLAKPAKREPHIDTICLSTHQAFKGDRCFVSGWGKDTFGKEGKFQVILKKIEVPVVPFALCQARLRTTKLAKWFKLHESFMCAGGEVGKDACRGDGGSALVCPLPGKDGYYYQAGIVSWGINCGDEGIPGVYVNVANYQLWIEEQFKLHQVLPESTSKEHGNNAKNPEALQGPPETSVKEPSGLIVGWNPESLRSTTVQTSLAVLPPSEDGKDGVLTATEPSSGYSTTRKYIGDVLTSTVVPSVHEPSNTEHSCGLRNEEGVGFRITGNMDGEAEYGEFPWMVAVLKEEEAVDKILNVYVCGGSLIHPLAVLTAAHCVHDKNKDLLSVRAGEWDTQTKNEVYGHSDHDVDEIVVHENFKAGPLHNGVALLFLKTPVKYQPHISPVCLPQTSTRFDKNRCFITGWGKDVFGKEGKYQVILKKIDVPIVPLATCQAQLRETRLGKRFKLHDSFLCAGGERGRDACRGDGGSPLVCPVPGKEGHYYQAGIVAWGISCGEENVPGVYVSVAKFRSWIDEKMSLRQLDTKSYTLS